MIAIIQIPVRFDTNINWHAENYASDNNLCGDILFDTTTFELTHRNEGGGIFTVFIRPIDPDNKSGKKIRPMRFTANYTTLEQIYADPASFITQTVWKFDDDISRFYTDKLYSGDNKKPLEMCSLDDNGDIGSLFMDNKNEKLAGLTMTTYKNDERGYHDTVVYSDIPDFEFTPEVLEAIDQTLEGQEYQVITDTKKAKKYLKKLDKKYDTDVSISEF